RPHQGAGRVLQENRQRERAGARHRQVCRHVLRRRGRQTARRALRRRHMKKLSLALSMVAIAVLAGPIALAPGPAQKTAGKLGGPGRPDQAALELALRRGYFEQEGLDIQTVQANTGMEMLPSLATNQLQVASGSPNAALFNALNRGIDIRLVADFAH